MQPTLTYRSGFRRGSALRGLAKGLLFAHCPTLGPAGKAFDVVGGKHGTFTNFAGGENWEVENRNGCYRYPDGDNGYISFALPDIGNPEGTIVQRIKPENFGLNSTVQPFFDLRGTSPTRSFTILDWTSHLWYCGWYHATNGDRRVAFNGGAIGWFEQDKWATFVMTWGSHGTDIIKGGRVPQLIANNATDPGTSVFDTTVADTCWIGRTSSGYYARDLKISDTFIWDRVLNEAEINRIHYDLQAPLRDLQRPRRRYFAVPAGAGGGTVPIFHKHYQSLRTA